MALFGSKKNKEVKREGGALGVRGPLAGAKSAEGERGASTRQRDPRTQGSDLAQVSSPLLPIIHRGQHHDIIIRPRITEKSGMASEPQNDKAAVYTFEVRQNATKPMIAQHIKALYKVSPVKVRIVNLPAKRVFVRGKRGTSNGVKKAMIYLKKGEKINLT